MTCKIINKELGYSTTVFTFDCDMSPPNGFRLKNDIEECTIQIQSNFRREIESLYKYTIMKSSQELLTNEFSACYSQKLRFYKMIAAVVKTETIELSYLEPSTKDCNENFNFNLNLRSNSNVITANVKIGNVSAEYFLSHIFFRTYDIFYKEIIPYTTRIEADDIIHSLSENFYSSLIDNLDQNTLQPTFMKYCIEPLEQNKESNPLSSDPLNNVASLTYTGYNPHSAV